MRGISILSLLSLVVSADLSVPAYHFAKPQSARTDCECKYRIEFAHVQDMTSSFEELLAQWKTFATVFASALADAYPSMRYTLTSFGDKPLPWLGYGFGDPYTSISPDYCYSLETPFSDIGDGSVLSSAIRGLPPTSGGNDLPENQFGALINTALDSNIDWSDGDVAEDGKLIIKVAALVTNSTSHGHNLGGQEKQSGGIWPKRSSLSKGKDMRTHVIRWFRSWGNQAVAATDRRIHSTIEQLNFSANCYVGSDLSLDYINIGEKILKGETLTREEKTRWYDEVHVQCGPANIIEDLGFSSLQEFVENSVNDGTFQDESLCNKTEYPNQDQVAAALESRGISPIFLLLSGSDDGDAAYRAYYKFAHGCETTSTVDCVRDFYSDAFAAYSDILQPQYLQASTADDISQWAIRLFGGLNNIIEKRCAEDYVCPGYQITSSTSTSSTTRSTTTTTTTTTTITTITTTSTTTSTKSSTTTTTTTSTTTSSTTSAIPNVPDLTCGSVNEPVCYYNETYAHVCVLEAIFPLFDPRNVTQGPCEGCEECSEGTECPGEDCECEESGCESCECGDECECNCHDSETTERQIDRYYDS